MVRYLMIAMVAAANFRAAALGAPIQPIVGAPSAYVPGQLVTFEVRLPEAANLGAYNVDVVLESSFGSAGVDFYFDVDATTPATAGYVFPSSANYFDAAIVDSTSRHRITLTDFDFLGGSVTVGVNDRVATVALRTAPTFSGLLSLFVDAPLLILDTPDAVPTPVPGFDAIKTDIAAAGAIELQVVPEPHGAVLIVTAFAIGRRRARRTGKLNALTSAKAAATVDVFGNSCRRSPASYLSAPGTPAG